MTIRIRTLFALFLALTLLGTACAKDPVTTLLNNDVDNGELDRQVVDLTLTEFSINGNLTVTEGHIVLALRNEGAAEHNVSFEGGLISDNLMNGETTNLDLGPLSPGTYELLCEIPGHKEAGMTATLTVVAAGEALPASDGHDGHDGHGDDVDWEEMDRIMLESIAAFPAETEGLGNQLLEPTMAADGTKEFQLTAAITEWEVEPGRTVEAWTYNGMVPGPNIKVDVGDNVRVTIQNDLPLGTDIHWHGISTPNNMDGVAPLTQDLIKSGETFTYEFIAEEPRVGMYHAHHMGHLAIPNGLLGLFTIGEPQLPYGETIGGVSIPEDLEIAQHIPMVLNDAGAIGYSLNGKSFPATQPYVVTEGDWIVVDYYNEGLQIHPMHMHQFPQLVFAKDGFPLDQPYFADTINIAPGERYSVLVQPDTPGAWVWHCHILSHVERDSGMFGMVTAVIVQEA